MFDFLKKILAGGGKRKQSVEELRKAFKERYGRFRSLLQANNRVLDIMAEMQQALDAGCSSFIRKPIDIDELHKQVAEHIASVSSAD